MEIRNGHQAMKSRTSKMCIDNQPQREPHTENTSRTQDLSQKFGESAHRPSRDTGHLSIDLDDRNTKIVSSELHEQNCLQESHDSDDGLRTQERSPLQNPSQASKMISAPRVTFDFALEYNPKPFVEKTVYQHRQETEDNRIGVYSVWQRVQATHDSRKNNPQTRLSTHLLNVLYKKLRRSPEPHVRRIEWTCVNAFPHSYIQSYVADLIAVMWSADLR